MANWQSTKSLGRTSRLTRRFYNRDVVLVARQLLGKRLVRVKDGVLTSGLIVETEAYLAEGDPACHGTRGPTPGNEVMFGSAGLAYVYPIHARHCFNAVAGPVGQASAVLIRAIEPREGLNTMLARRALSDERLVANGPARLCEALAITRSVNGLDLTSADSIWIDRVGARRLDDAAIKSTRRIGVTSAKSLRLRFVIAGSPAASGPKRMR